MQSLIGVVWLVIGTMGSIGAAERTISAGIHAGQVGLSGIGIGVERGLDETNTNTTAYTLGTFMFDEVYLGQQVRRYFKGPTLRPVVGLGLCEIAGQLDRRVMLSVSGFCSAGLDWTVFEAFHCGVELMLHAALYNYLIKSENGVVDNEGFYPAFLTPGLRLYVQRELSF
jgi:hypothetical protein